MVSAITNGVKVSVKTEYQAFYSNPMQANFVFSYRIFIENNSDATIQLLTRHWQIRDINGLKREVNGDGVVGLQPIIEPGESHEYVSGCNLTGMIGKMYGFYNMERIVDGGRFEVEIPEFVMEVPFLLN